MATFYWVGGTGTWNTSTTTNWASSTGGGGGAGVPTSADDVIIDTLSGTGTITCTAGVCNNLTVTAAQAIILGAASSTLSVFGSMTLPAAGLFSASTNANTITFASTSTGKTITTNGKSLSSINLNGIGGAWTLGSNLTCTGNITLTNGIFDTSSASSYSVSTQLFTIANSSNIRTLNLNASTFTCTGNNLSSFSIQFPLNVTINAGTSNIILSGPNAGLNISNTSGYTFYNVSFTSGTLLGGYLSGTNTFNNLTFNGNSSFNIATVSVFNTQTINGTFTVQSGVTDPTKRIFFRAGQLTSPVSSATISAAAISLFGVDFNGIIGAGAATWSDSTRTNYWGNATNNSGITFSTGRTAYWNLAGSQNWSATGWATTNNGVPAAANFPLPQDTATFTEAGSAGTVTINAGYVIGSIQMADGVSNRTTAFTFATGTATPTICGNVTLFSNLTFTGTGAFTFQNQTGTQTFTSAGKTLSQPINIFCGPSGTLQLQDTLTLGTTLTATLYSGTLNLNNQTLSTGLFSSSNSNTRNVTFGTGNITTTGSGTVWTTATATGLTYTGTPTVNISNNSATATTVTTGALTEAQALNFNYTTGTYTLTDTASVYRSLNFTGFTGTIPNSVRTIYGNLTLVAGMTLTAGTNTTTFASTSSGNTITSAAKTQDYPITFNGIGGVWTCQDALTLGSTRALTMTNGTLNLKSGATSTVGSFTTSGTNKKYLGASTPGSQATISDASGSNSVSYLTISDNNATGGATWLAYTDQSNIDAGNVDGWDFGISPVVGGAEYTYTIRSFTQPRRF